MAKNFRKDLEGVDLTSDLDMRTTEEVEAEADKKAKERPEKVLRFGDEDDEPAHEGSYDPATDKSYLTQKQVERESAILESKPALDESEVFEAMDRTIVGGGPRKEPTTGKVISGGRDAKKNHNLGKEINAKDDKTSERRESRGKRDIAA